MTLFIGFFSGTNESEIIFIENEEIRASGKPIEEVLSRVDKKSQRSSDDCEKMISLGFSGLETKEGIEWNKLVGNFVSIIKRFRAAFSHHWNPNGGKDSLVLRNEFESKLRLKL